MDKVRGASNRRICISILLMVVLNFYYGKIREVQMSVSELAGPSGIQPRIAVGIQGPADYLHRWRDVLSLMSTRSEVDFFCLIYDGTVNETMVDAWRQEPNSPLKEIMTNSMTTWTTGRNVLAQAMYREEVKRFKQYESWVFSDADSWLMDCARCPTGDLGAACCWDYMFRDVLLSNYSFATVATWALEEECRPVEHLSNDTVLDNTFIFRDCADAQVQAFHRDAVPILLPYHPDLDSSSWWSSQALLFKYASGCLRDANVVLGRRFQSQSILHKGYPKGRDFAKENSTVVNLFPSIADVLSRPGMCNAQHVGKIRNIDPLNPQLVDWQHSEAFLWCLAAKKPYFIKEIGMDIQPAPK